MSLNLDQYSIPAARSRTTIICSTSTTAAAEEPESEVEVEVEEVQCRGGEVRAREVSRW